MIVVFRERFLWSLPQEAALEVLMFFDWNTMMGPVWGSGAADRLRPLGEELLDLVLE